MMKRKKIIAVLLFLLLLCLACIYLLLPGQDQGQVTEQAREMIILQMDTEPVERVVCQKKSGEALSFKRTDTGWICENEPDFPLDPRYIERILECLAELPGKGAVENGALAAEKYGLKEPAAVLIVQAGESSLTLKVGDRNEITMNYYLQVNEDPTVYLVEPFLKVRITYDLEEMALLEKVPDVTPDGDCRIVLENKEYRNVLIAGDSAGGFSLEQSGEPADREKEEKLRALLNQLEFLQCYQFQPKTEELEELIFKSGLGKLEYTVSGQAEKQNYILNIGIKSGEKGYYAWPEGSEIIYLIDGALVEPLIGQADNALVRRENLVEESSGKLPKNVGSAGELSTVW